MTRNQYKQKISELEDKLIQKEKEYTILMNMFQQVAARSQKQEKQEEPKLKIFKAPIGQDEIWTK